MKAFVLASVFLAVAGAGAFGQTRGDLVVNISGLRNSTGYVLVAVFGGEQGFPVDVSKSVAQARGTIAGNRAVVRIQDLPAGTYAVSVVHDENANLRLDTGWCEPSITCRLS